MVVKRVWVAVFVLAAACGGGSATSSSRDSGIEGIVTIGPQCPVEIAGSPCPDKPFAGELAVTKQGSEDVVASARSGADGRFRLALAPGDYTIQPAPGKEGFPFGKPLDVTVRPHEFTDVTMMFDSGIR